MRGLAPFSLALLISTSALANNVENFYKLYEKGSYAEALEVIQKIKSTPDFEANKLYLKGLTLNKLQRYDEASLAFLESIRNENRPADIYYELGQALYANNDLERARESFKRSYTTGHNKGNSLYYIAHISQILEQHREARGVYKRLLKEKGTDPKLLQVSNFQYAESMLSIARDMHHGKEIIDLIVLPEFKRALDRDKTSNLAPDISRRITEIEKEFDLDPNQLKNGRRVNAKRYTLQFTQRLKNDSNVTLANDQPSVQTTSQSSIISDTQIYGKYEFVAKKRFTFNPELRMNYIHHFNRDTPNVYRNDAYTIAAAVNNTYEHTLFNAPASFLYEIEYNHYERDKNANKEKSFYARSTTYSIGERFQFFTFGETTIRLRHRKYEAYLSSLDNKTNSLSIDQVALLPNNHILIGLFQYDDYDNFNDTSNSTSSVLARADYIIPEFLPNLANGLGLHVAFSASMLDTKEQKATRGTEYTWSPFIRLNKRITQDLRINISHEYTKNTSKSVNHEYDKHVTTLEARYTF